MRGIRIDILDEKAKGTISELADQNLIHIEEDISKNNKQNLIDILDDISNNVTEPPMTMDEIVQEVKIVRKERYEAKQNSGR